MSPRISRRRNQTMVGVSLVVLGTVFFLDQMDIVPMQNLWQYWPWLLVAVGLVRIIDPASPRDVSSGCWTMLIGLWLCANFEGWYGINFGNSWPALLIGWGITMLLGPVLHQRLAGRQTDADATGKERNHAL